MAIHSHHYILQRVKKLFKQKNENLNHKHLTFYVKEYAYRLNESRVNSLPKITAQVVGYEVAYDLFKQMEVNNNPVPIDWTGEMNMTYSYGGRLNNDRFLNLFKSKFFN